MTSRRAASICRIGTLFGARLCFFSHSVRWCTARFTLADAIGIFCGKCRFSRKKQKSSRLETRPEKQTRQSHRAHKTGWTCPNFALGRFPNPPAKRSYGTPRLRSQTLADAGAVSMLSRPTFLHRKLHNNTQGKRPTECGTGRRRSSATARNRLSDGALVVSTRQADCQTSRRLLA